MLVNSSCSIDLTVTADDEVVMVTEDGLVSRRVWWRCLECGQGGYLDGVYHVRVEERGGGNETWFEVFHEVKEYVVIAVYVY